MTGQKAASTSQIKFEKNNIPRTRKPLAGKTMGSFQAAHVRPIEYLSVEPGQPIHSLKWYGAIKLLTPQSPVFENLNVTFYTVKIPKSEVWENWEKFQAYQTNGTSSTINEIPNFGGKYIPRITNNAGTDFNILSNTSAWRDSIISAFIPRTVTAGMLEEENIGKMPKNSCLPVRAAVKAWNEIFRDRRYESKLQEFKDDTCTDAEWNYYMPNTAEKLINLKFRSKLPDSYYSNYRLDLQANVGSLPEFTNTPPEEDLLRWIAWENQADFARTSAEMGDKSERMAIAELYGSAPAQDGKVELIGKVTEPLNYSAITQSAYNTNMNIQEKYRTMGTQGAYSYTSFNGLQLCGERVFRESCIIMIFANVWATTSYTSAFDRMDLNVSINDLWRPDRIEEKTDVLYAVELGTEFASEVQENARYSQVVGFKRKFSEYGKLRNTICNDATENEILQYTPTEDADVYIETAEIDVWNSNETYITNYTYNFSDQTQYFKRLNNYLSYENAIDYSSILAKAIWKDYTDLILDRNLAVKAQKLLIESDEMSDVVMNGQQQIQYGGYMVLDTTLSMPEEIFSNYTSWGEH